METVTVSSKFRVVIPKKIWETLGLRAGDKIHVIVYENRIELIPVKTIQGARGLLKGIDTSVEQETDRL